MPKVQGALRAPGGPPLPPWRLRNASSSMRVPASPEQMDAHEEPGDGVDADIPYGASVPGSSSCPQRRPTRTRGDDVGDVSKVVEVSDDLALGIADEDAEPTEAPEVGLDTVDGTARVDVDAAALACRRAERARRFGLPPRTSPDRVATLFGRLPGGLRRDRALSKRLSRLLRYEAKERRLTLDRANFVPVAEVLRELRRCTYDDLRDVVAWSVGRRSVPRFELATRKTGRGEEAVEMIRATRKHNFGAKKRKRSRSGRSHRGKWPQSSWGTSRPSGHGGR